MLLLKASANKINLLMLMITVDEAGVFHPENPYILSSHLNGIGTWILLRDFIWIYNTFQIQTHNSRSMQMGGMLSSNALSRVLNLNTILPWIHYTGINIFVCCCLFTQMKWEHESNKESKWQQQQNHSNSKRVLKCYVLYQWYCHSFSFAFGSSIPFGVFGWLFVTVCIFLLAYRSP